jgi:energy-converting hydrogenase Eha subunit G
MPFIGLVITSAAYTIPVFFAFRRRVYHVAKTCGLLTVTSMLFHCTQNDIYRKVDEVVAHTAGICYSVISVKNVIVKRRCVDVAIAAAALTSGWMFFYKSKPCKFEHISQYWHMGVHGLSNLAWTLYVVT